MNPRRSTNRRYLVCLLLLSAVLVLGIVQWSFLPILIQNGPIGSSAVLEMSAGHSSKFAAPFKGLFSDKLQPCLAQARITAQKTATRIFRTPEAPIYSQDDFSLSYHPLRAPPSA
jgi:hypothetical protein